jgi:hypothetical protein
MFRPNFKSGKLWYVIKPDLSFPNAWIMKVFLSLVVGFHFNPNILQNIHFSVR